MDVPHARLAPPRQPVPASAIEGMTQDIAEAETAKVASAPRMPNPERVIWLSPSQMSALQKCPRSWAMSHRRRPRPASLIGLPATLGTAVHKTIETEIGSRMLAHDRGSRQTMSLASLLATFADAWREALAWDDPLSMHPIEARQEMLSRGAAVVQTYYAWANRPGLLFYPRAKEYKLEARHPDDPAVMLTGRADGFTAIPPAELLMEGERPDEISEAPSIFDWKTYAKPMAPGAEYEGDQGPFYRLALHLEGRAFQRFWYMTFPRREHSDGTATASVDARGIELSRFDELGMRRKTLAMAQFIRRMDTSGFYKAQPQPLCRWCEYQAHCPEGQAFMESRGWKPAIPVLDASQSDEWYAARAQLRRSGNQQAAEALHE